MIKEGEYKGRPTITLFDGPEDKFGFTFGSKKARMIIQHIPEITEFVQKHSGVSRDE